MQVDQAKEIVQQITYKPGSHISVGDVVGGSLRLNVKHVVEDVLGRGEVTVGRSTHVRTDVLKRMDESEFIRFVMDAVIELEVHEVHEWFQVNGEPFINPHPEAS